MSTAAPSHPRRAGQHRERPGAVEVGRTDYGAFRVAPLTPHIGAEVDGIDLAEPLDDAATEALHQAWADWSVLVFRDQHLDREAHKRFGRAFGPLHTHPMNHARGGDPEILVVRTTADSAYTAGDGWHTDVSCEAIPPMASALYITEVPECGGGDTLYADMYLAYEMLSEPMQQMLEGLTAVHDGALPYVGQYKSTPPEGGYPRHEHPVVTVHPVTGRKVLFVNSGFTSHIRGLQPWESRALLDYLQSLAQHLHYHCRVKWRQNTLIVWDNRFTLHRGVHDFKHERRHLIRTTVIGEKPLGVADWHG